MFETLWTPACADNDILGKDASVLLDPFVIRYSSSKSPSFTRCQSWLNGVGFSSISAFKRCTLCWKSHKYDIKSWNQSKIMKCFRCSVPVELIDFAKSIVWHQKTAMCFITTSYFLTWSFLLSWWLWPIHPSSVDRMTGGGGSSLSRDIQSPQLFHGANKVLPSGPPLVSPYL